MQLILLKCFSIDIKPSGATIYFHTQLHHFLSSTSFLPALRSYSVTLNQAIWQNGLHCAVICQFCLSITPFGGFLSISLQRRAQKHCLPGPPSFYSSRLEFATENNLQNIWNLGRGKAVFWKGHGTETGISESSLEALFFWHLLR